MIILRLKKCHFWSFYASFKILFFSLQHPSYNPKNILYITDYFFIADTVNTCTETPFITSMNCITFHGTHGTHGEFNPSRAWLCSARFTILFWILLEIDFTIDSNHDGLWALNRRSVRWKTAIILSQYSHFYTMIKPLPVSPGKPLCNRWQSVTSMHSNRINANGIFPINISTRLRSVFNWNIKFSFASMRFYIRFYAYINFTNIIKI